MFLSAGIALGAENTAVTKTGPPHMEFDSTATCVHSAFLWLTKFFKISTYNS